VIDEMLIVHSLSPQYNAFGELVCTNGGALFSNNVSTSNQTICNANALWIMPMEIDCYTGIFATCTTNIQCVVPHIFVLVVWQFKRLQSVKF